MPANLQSTPYEQLKSIAHYMDIQSILRLFETYPPFKTLLVKDEAFWKLKALQYQFYHLHPDNYELEIHRQFNRDYIEYIGKKIGGAHSPMIFETLESGAVIPLDDQSYAQIFDGFVHLIFRCNYFWQRLASQTRLSHYYQISKRFFESNVYSKSWLNESHCWYHRTMTQNPLFWALLFHQPLEEIKRILGEHPEYLDDEYSHSGRKLHPIHIAAHEGLLDIVQYFLELDNRLLNKPVYHFTEMRCTPLSWAASGNQTHVLRYLLEQKNIEFEHEALTQATFEYAPESLTLLLEMSIDKKASLFDWLKFALKSLVITQLTFEHRPHLITEPGHDMPLVCFAAEHASLFVFNYILGLPGMDPNQSFEGLSVLSYAMKGYMNQLAKIETLLKAGASLTFLPPNGELVIHTVVKENQYGSDMIGALLRLDPSLLNLPDHNGLPAVFLKVDKKNYYDKTVKFFLSQPNIALELNSTSTYCSTHPHQPKTLFHVAIIEGNDQSLQELVAKEPRFLTSPTGTGESPLLLACKLDMPKIVDFLLEQKEVDVNAANPQSATPLSYCLQHNKPKFTEKLLARGAFIDTSSITWPPFISETMASDNTQETPLPLIGAQKSFPQVIETIARCSAPDLKQIKAYYKDKEPKLITVLNRLERGSQQCNPYWMNSSKKLNRLVSCLWDMIQNNESVRVALLDTNSELYKAVNQQRISFFKPLTQSMKIIDQIWSFGNRM